MIVLNRRTKAAAIVLLAALLSARDGAVVWAAMEADQCVVGIDAGHSPDSPGATSARGKGEWDFNLRLAREFAAAVNGTGWAKAFLINGNGETPTLTQRAPRAKELGATVFYSIHHDSVQPQYLTPWVHEGRERFYTDMIDGYSIFISATGSHPRDSLALAQTLGQELTMQGYHPSLHHAEPVKGENRDLVDRGLGIYRFDELAVLRTASLPALLFEAGVIVNKDEEERLETYGYREGLVAALTQSVLDFCMLNDMSGDGL